MKGVVYKIVCNETTETYYGSTVQKLKNRIKQHCWNSKSSARPCKSKTIIDRNNFRFEVCEEVFCENRKELLLRERYWIENNDCLNKFVPLRTYPEFYKDNQSKILNYKKEHYQKNREKILAYKKEYHEKNREKILEKARIRREIITKTTS